MLEKQNKAAVYLLQYFNGQVSYFSNLLTKYEGRVDDWTMESYKMTIRLNRDNVEKLEQWIEKQTFEYE